MSRIGRSRVLASGLVLPDVSRRGFIRGSAAAGLGLGVPSLLSACGTEGTTQTADECKSTDKSDSEKELFFSNWPEYMDIKGKRMPTLEAFEDESGVDVTYNTDINDNNEFFAKVSNQLGDCQPIGRDIIVLTDWMAARLASLGWLQKLDRANMPNVDANLVATLKNPAWDPNGEYGVPWQTGLTGIAYNKSALDKPPGSMEEMLTRPDLKGNVTLLKEMRDTMGFMLRIVGADQADFTDDEWGQAIERLEGYVGAGQVRRFTGNDYIQDLANGDLLAAEAWSGDVTAAEDPNIGWVIPEEGLNIWSDIMLVPNKAEHKTNAEMLMNHYYDPDVAAQLAAFIWYVCPVVGAQEAMEKVDPNLVDQQLIFPTEDFLANASAFMSLDEETSRQYDTDFSQAIG